MFWVYWNGKLTIDHECLLIFIWLRNVLILAFPNYVTLEVGAYCRTLHSIFLVSVYISDSLTILIFSKNQDAYLYHVTVCKICKMCQALSTLLVLTNAALRFQSCLMGFCLYFNRFVDLGGTDRMLVGRRSDSRKYQQQYKQLRFCKQHVNNKYSN